MSWNFSVKAGPAADFEEACNAALVEFREQSGNGSETPEVNDQVLQAIGAAKHIVASGAVGTGLVAALLSGHANFGHKPRAGWSHDSVHVTVECAEPYPPRT